MNYKLKKVLLMLSLIVIVCMFHNNERFVNKECPQDLCTDTNPCYDSVHKVCNPVGVDDNDPDKCNTVPGYIWCKPGDGPDPSPDPGPDPGPDPSPDPSPDSFVKGMCYTMPTMYHENGDKLADNIKTDVAADSVWSIARRRNDLQIMKTMGVTHLRIYDWDLGSLHGDFMDNLESHDIKLMVSISNYFVFNNPSALSEFISNFMNDIAPNNKYRKCIHSIAIGNEPDLNGDSGSYEKTIAALDTLLQSDNSISNKDSVKLTIPVAFGSYDGKGPSVKQLLDIHTKLERFGIFHRYIPSIQTTNFAIDVKNLFYDKLESPIKEHIDRYGFYITEWSGPALRDNSDHTKTFRSDDSTEQLMKIKDDIHLKGIFCFQYINPIDKDDSEGEFGFTRFNCDNRVACPKPNEKICEFSNSLHLIANAYGGEAPNIPKCTPSIESSFNIDI